MIYKKKEKIVTTMTNKKKNILGIKAVRAECGPRQPNKCQSCTKILNTHVTLRGLSIWAVLLLSVGMGANSLPNPPPTPSPPTNHVSITLRPTNGPTP